MAWVHISRNIFRNLPNWKRERNFRKYHLPQTALVGYTHTQISDQLRTPPHGAMPGCQVLQQGPMPSNTPLQTAVDDLPGSDQQGHGSGFAAHPCERRQRRTDNYAYLRAIAKKFREILPDHERNKQEINERNIHTFSTKCGSKPNWHPRAHSACVCVSCAFRKLKRASHILC